MGGNNAKLSVISYDEAAKRVTDSELRRLRDGFRKLSGINGTMSVITFVRDVLGDGTPLKLAERVFYILGGHNTKGLTFKDLVCGLVVLTRGKEEEKIKLIFSLFCDETHSYIERSEMEQTIVAIDDQLPQQLSSLFAQSSRVDFDAFRSWLKFNRSALSVSQWLLTEPCKVTLTNDHETPTFYQTLAGVTHLEESDFTLLEKCYWTIKSTSTSGKFDLETLTNHVCPPLPIAMVPALFRAFDENRDGHIDFKEMACGISACCRGPTTDRHKFCFKIFDSDSDGRLSRLETLTMVDTMIALHDPASTSDPGEIVQELLGEREYLTQGEYLIWAVTHELPQNLLQLLVQICHVVMGLKPLTREDERKVVMAWLARTARTPYRVGETFYLISMSWWRAWKTYVGEHNVGNGRAKSAAGLCPSLGRKYDVQGDADTEENVIGVNYSTLPSPPSNSPVAESPRKFNTVPRSNGQVTPKNSASSLSTPPPSPSRSPRPGQIDNSSLVLSTTTRVLSLTNEGGVLRRDRVLTRGRDFELVPEAVWKALWAWYGSSMPLPRSVMVTSEGSYDLELYPVQVKLFKHQTSPRPAPTTTITGMVGGLGGLVMGSPAPRKYLAHTACFSRKHTIGQVLEFISSRLKIGKEDIHLYIYKDEQNLILLDTEETLVEESGIQEGTHLLIEVRNKDLTWPEELNQLARNRGSLPEGQAAMSPGVTGLSNLGNTCFMNSALQCVSNTQALTKYFEKSLHRFELNRNNPLGMRGHVAMRYAELIQDIWSGKHRSVAPLKMRWTIAKYAPRFNGFQQHDCQELLAFLLDGLHEDLNRVQEKPYKELKDSDGRPDEEVAQEAWENHLQRNRSVVVDLFHGQLKSCVRCKVCQHTSVRFDPFTCLSLPLPMEGIIYLEIIVLWLDGSTPVRYGLELNSDDTYRVLKQKLSKLCDVSTCELMLAEVYGALIKSYPADSEKVKVAVLCSLWAYQVLPPPPLPSISPQQERNPSPPPPLVIQPTVPAGGRAGGQTGGERAGEVSGLSADEIPPANVIVAVHRKMLRMDSYLLSFQKTRPNLFGTPVVIPCHDTTTGRELYQQVWKLVTRLVSPMPAEGTHNHAEDCDDSLAYAYPFTLRLVDRDGLACSSCPWFSFCRGCRIECDDELFRHASLHIAIDWEPTALHLRYQSSQEKYSTEHESVEECRRRRSEPIDLYGCLAAFTKEEELEETWYCSRCKKHQQAAKKLQIWRLPPVLIVHLKRFQLVHNRWVKSQKVVQFPFQDFDPSEYLVSRRVPNGFLTLGEGGGGDTEAGGLCGEVNGPRTDGDRADGSENNHVTEKSEHLVNSASESSQGKVTHDVNKSDSRQNIGRNSPEKIGKSEELGKSPDKLGKSPEHRGKSPEHCVKSPEKLGKSPRASKSAEKVGKSPATLGGEAGGQGEAVVCQDGDKSSIHSSEEQEGVEEVAVEARESSMELNSWGRDVEDYEGVKYSLYSLACHSGQLGCGHYVAFAKNANDKWYCFNDSMCKEVPESQVDTSSAYILFYERDDLDWTQFMPNVANKEPDNLSIEDECESEIRRYCSIM